VRESSRPLSLNGWQWRGEKALVVATEDVNDHHQQESNRPVQSNEGPPQQNHLTIPEIACGKNEP
jgi:hypothetical protein